MLDNNLKIIRLESKISQSVAAEAISVSRSTYAMYEAGFRVPDIETVYKLAKLFSVPMEYIYSDDPARFTDAAQMHMHMSRMEKELILNYRYLNNYSRGRLLERCQALLEEQRRLNENANRQKLDRERFKKRHDKRLASKKLARNGNTIICPFKEDNKEDEEPTIEK